MKFASTHSLSLVPGLPSKPITVEAAVRGGLPGLHIGGGAYGSRETCERIRAALTASSFPLPYASISVGFSPAGDQRRGGGLDLAVAAALLCALGAPDPESLLGRLQSQKALFFGELSMDGSVRPSERDAVVRLEARRLGFTHIVMPEKSEPVDIPGLHVFRVRAVSDLLLPPADPPTPSSMSLLPRHAPWPDESVLLPPNIVRALTIAAAGWHSMLLVGPPGTGKSTAGRLLGSLLPPPAPSEIEEMIAFRNGSLLCGEIERPVRSPHHLATARSIIGGGTPLQPGEVTLAHRGVLLLDELAEFQLQTLQSLREPMEEGVVHLSRVGEALDLPARFLFAATANPCPCGFYGDGSFQCHCPPSIVRSYISRILGPLRDRIHLEVITQREPGKLYSIQELQKAVKESWGRQKERMNGFLFGETAGAHLASFVPFRDAHARNLFLETGSRPGISARVLTGIRRTAGTISDLDERTSITVDDIREAASYRALDHYTRRPQ